MLFFTNSVKNNKKQQLNLDAIEILSNSENAPILYLPQEKDTVSFWGKFVNFFNPFQCGHN